VGHEYGADSILRAQEHGARGHAYAVQRQVYAFNTKTAPFDDLGCARLVMALDRRISRALTSGLPGRPAIPTTTARGSGAKTTARCLRSGRRS
jgi:hypothetical protein